MRGFIIGTAATAITFAVVAYFLPMIKFGDNLPGLIVLAIIAGLVNGFIKPVIKILSLPLTMVSFGLFRARHQRRAAAARRLALRPRGREVHGRWLPAAPHRRHVRRGGDRRHRDERRRDDRRHRGPRLNGS